MPDNLVDCIPVYIDFFGVEFNIGIGLPTDSFAENIEFSAQILPE